jgi:dipeptidyl-peptidase 4
MARPRRSHRRDPPGRSWTDTGTDLAPVDGAHRGAFGWGCGGDVTLMLLAKRSDVIAAGAAVAPVMDRRLCDTCHRNHHRGQPRDDSQGYADSAVCSGLDGLRARYCSCTAAGNNVRFVNATRLMTERQQHGIQIGLVTDHGAQHAPSTPQLKVPAIAALRCSVDAHLKPPHFSAASRDGRGP